MDSTKLVPIDTMGASFALLVPKKCTTAVAEAPTTSAVNASAASLYQRITGVEAGACST